MPCVDDNTLGAVLDGSIEPSVRASVLSHIETCGSCRRLVATVFSPGMGGELPSVREGDRLGRYEVVGSLGRGGMGVVYAARDPELSRDVAVKLIRRRHRVSDDELSDRLRRESRAMAKLSHPNVTAVYDVGVGEAGIFVALELVAGTSLREWMAEERSQTEVVEALRQAGAGLQAAHRAKVIHRDFKPDNVLVGEGGDLVKVTDFGLAQLVGDDGDEQGDDEDRLVGTLAYMAPEQLSGGDVDERADQFAFFVTLWEALYGERPFGGESPGELLAAITEGPPTPPSTPRWLGDAIKRGLSASRDDRFESMDEALAALQPRRRGRLAVAVAAVAIAAAAVFFAVVFKGDSDACAQGTEQMAEVWPPARRIQVARALYQASAENGEFTAKAVIAALDAGTERWIDSHREACEATRAGHQSADLLDRRVFCLDGKRREFAALLDRIERGSSQLAETALPATLTTTDISRCADLAALAATLPPPAGDARATVTSLQESMASLRAQLRMSDFDGLLEAAQSHRERAGEVGYKPLVAEAQLLVARVLDELDRTKEAAAAYREAALAAAGSRHDHAAADAWNELIFVVGYSLADHERGLEIAKQAKAAIERIGGDQDLEATRLANAGLVAHLSGDTETAKEWLETAIEMWRGIGKGESIEVTAAMDGLAELHRERGEFDLTAELNQQTLSIRERVLGANHPHLAASLATLATVHYMRAEFEPAQALLDRCLAIQRASLPPTHRDIAVTLVLQGLVWGQTEPEKAEAPIREALKIQIDNLGPNHPEVGKSYLNLGSVLSDVGKFDEAREQYLAGLEVAKVTLGEDHTDYGLYLYYLAELDRQRGRCPDALETYRRAIVLLGKIEGSTDVVTMQIGLGRCLVDVGRPEEAIAPLEDAIKRLKSGETDAVALGEPMAVLGVARYMTGAKKRGRAEAASALAILEQAPNRFSYDIEAVKEWLAENP